MKTRVLEDEIAEVVAKLQEKQEQKGKSADAEQAAQES